MKLPPHNKNGQWELLEDGYDGKCFAFNNSSENLLFRRAIAPHNENRWQHDDDSLRTGTVTGKVIRVLNYNFENSPLYMRLILATSSSMATYLQNTSLSPMAPSPLCHQCPHASSFITYGPPHQTWCGADSLFSLFRRQEHMLLLSPFLSSTMNSPTKWNTLPTCCETRQFSPIWHSKFHPIC